jgi:CubicO group peptidase (beta-lactamase class C family)
MGTVGMSGFAERVAAEDGFSGVVHIARGEEVVFSAAVGLRHRGEALPVLPDTRFAIASGSKLFTALAIDALVAEGRLALGDRLVDRADTGLDWLDPEITIEQLLRHTSGAASYFDGDDFEALWRDLPVYRVLGPRDVLPLFAGKQMQAAPGERFAYNDGGYVLLGLVVESVTGAPFADVVEEKVLRPFGMSASGYWSADRLPGNTAVHYVDDGRANIFCVTARGQPDGGAYTTAPDLARLWSRLATHDLLDAPLTETGMRAPHLHAGRGFWAESPRHVFVEGWDPGVAMWSGLLRDRGVSVTVLGNSNHELGPLYRDLVTLAG